MSTCRKMGCFLAAGMVLVFFLVPLSSANVIQKSLTPIELSTQDSGLKEVDCIYVINLKDRPVKWEHMKRVLSEQGLKANRVDAVNGWALTEEAKKRLTTGGYGLGGGQIGCALSHISVWKHALDQGWKTFWVMEDDVVFMQPVSALKEIIAELDRIDPKWDVLYTDPEYRNAEGRFLFDKSWDLYRKHPDVLVKKMDYYRQRKEVSPHLVRTYGRWGAYSMIISKSGVNKLFSQIASHSLFSPIDHQIHTAVPSLRQYAIKEPLATQMTRQGSDTVFSTVEP